MLGSNAERAKDLAYRLYTLAERKGWTQEGYAYNALVVAWRGDPVPCRRAAAGNAGADLFLLCNTGRNETMSENYTKVQQAFRVLHPLLAGYICQEMRREYQDNWWQEVLMTLSDQVRDLPDDNGDYATLMDSLDMANCLRLFDRKWNDLFKRKLSIDYRTWAKELMGVRNKLAHIGGTDFSEDDTWRALDTMGAPVRSL